jgi:hypothetical protein
MRLKSVRFRPGVPGLDDDGLKAGENLPLGRNLLYLVVKASTKSKDSGCHAEVQEKIIHRVQYLFSYAYQWLGGNRQNSAPVLPTPSTGLSTVNENCGTLHQYDIDLTGCAAANSHQTGAMRGVALCQGR